MSTTVIDETCFLLHSFLSASEQCVLFEYIDKLDCTPWDTIPRAMVPSPKTLVFSSGKPMLPLVSSDPSPATDMVDRAHEQVLGSGQGQVPSHCGDLLRSAVGDSQVSMAVIRYEAPDGKFPPHVDHCNGSLVYLMTLGCTARFMVKAPNMEERQTFDLESGDMLVFDASTQANVLHGVLGIKEGSCPAHLAKKFPVMKGHRFGVQCRVRVG